MKTISFEEYQKILMSSFKVINDYFVSNNIKWWAHSGTLLGAARDKNIISWDDDIDMTMSSHTWINSKEKIQSFLKTINWVVYDSFETPALDATRLFSKEVYKVEYNGEFYITKPFIDIMISIPVKNMTKTKSFLWSVHNQYNFIFSPRYRLIPYYGWFGTKVRKIHPFVNFLVFFQKILLYLFTFWVPLSKKIYLKRKKHYSQKIAMYYNYNNKGIIYDVDNINTLHKFGDTFIYSSDSWEEELDIWFGGKGKWKTLPPEWNRVPHHLLLTKSDKKNDSKYKIEPYIII